MSVTGVVICHYWLQLMVYCFNLIFIGSFMHLKGDASIKRLCLPVHLHFCNPGVTLPSHHLSKVNVTSIDTGNCRITKQNIVQNNTGMSIRFEAKDDV